MKLTCRSHIVQNPTPAKMTNANVSTRSRRNSGVFSMNSVKMNTADKYCVIGAGAAGLAIAKTFKARGIPFDCLERENDLGGLWNIGTNSGLVYETTHFVSSREFQGYEDFPMPEDWPVYPSHEYGLVYLRNYAEHFGIDELITYNRTVEKIEPNEKGWRVWLKEENGPLQYRGVVIANGHHDVPRYPDYPGEFSGSVLHSRDYRSPTQLTGERILVIGAGNSGCDIAVDAVHLGRDVMLSMRRGYYFVPNFTLGWPTDDVMDSLEAVPMPRKFRSWLYSLHHFISVGRYERFGLQKPDYGILEAHPTVNSHIPLYASQGLITPKPAISQLNGDTVHFTDGSAEKIDMIVYATGYEISVPFIDRSHIFADDGAPKLFLNIFHRDRNDLFAAGLIQANGSIWRTADMQAQLISNYIVASHTAPDDVRWFDDLKASTAAPLARKIMPVASERHTLEVNYFDYRRVLKKFNRKFRKFAGKRLEPTASAPAASVLSATASTP